MKKRKELLAPATEIINAPSINKKEIVAPTKLKLKDLTPLVIKNPSELTTKELKLAAPAAFSQEIKDHLSGRYVFIQTSKVIKKLAMLGYKFYPVKAEQAHKRKNDDGFQKHIIVFRSSDERLSIIDENGKQVETVQLYLTNSHDGTTNFMLSLGIFKFDSGNDFNIPESILGFVKIKHVGYSLEKLRASVELLMQNLPFVYKRIETMKKRILTESEVVQFSMHACKARWKENLKIDEEDLIKNIGEKTNLWNVFSTMQETLTKGGEFKVNNRKIRPLNHITDKENLNKKLFLIADNFLFSTT